MKFSLQRYFPLLVMLGIALNATGLFSYILEPDGALYASISKHIAITNDWVNLIGDNHDWLDKPHFPFWVTALSFKAFGINSFAYKFPAFLFWLAGLRITYLFAKDLYNRTTAQITVLVYIIALHAVLANFDVRAEPYLTTLTIGSIYYIYKNEKSGRWSHLLLAAIFAACAVMTKGIFILITIGGGFIIYWMVTKQWKQFLNYRWWILILLIFIFIIPELYCLYVQFDMHPEKVVFGQTGVSGIHFFFWDSQFGRFLNTGPIKGSGDISFFFHTTLWAFLPWSVILYIAVFRLVWKKNVVINKAEWIILASAGITFIIFSLSRFQLPHYIIILFPQFSMMVAAYLVSVFTSGSEKTRKIISLILSVNLVIVTLFETALILLMHLKSGYIFFPLMVIAIVAVFIFFRKSNLDNTVLKAFSFALLLYPFLNLLFYPYILQYQAGMEAGLWLNKHHYQGSLGMYKEFTHTLEFYSDVSPKWLYNENDVEKYIEAQDSAVIFANARDADSLRLNGLNVKVIRDFDYFRVSMLDLKFLNPSTRPETLTKMELMNVSKPGSK